MAKILFIEDVEDNANMAGKILRSENHEFLWAQTGAEGLQMALENIPDLILLDLGLPDVDGQTLSTWIRGEYQLRDIPLIVMTAWPETTARQTVRAYQLDGYIGKPFKVKEFLKVINEFL